MDGHDLRITFRRLIIRPYDRIKAVAHVTEMPVSKMPPAPAEPDIEPQVPNSLELAPTRSLSPLWACSLALLWALYVGQPVVLPIVVAAVLRLLLQPIFRLRHQGAHAKDLAALVTITFLVIVGLLVLAPLMSSSRPPDRETAEAASRLSERLSLLRSRSIWSSASFIVPKRPPTVRARR